MTLSLDICTPEEFSDRSDDNTFSICIISDTESYLTLDEDMYDMTVCYDMVDISTCPADIKDMDIKPFNWDAHGAPINNAIKSILRDSSHDHLLIVSKDVTVEAAGLALGISESRLFKGVTTEFILTKCQAEADINTMVEFLGLKPDLVKYAKKAYPEKAKELTRYDLLGELSDKEVLNEVFLNLSRYRTTGLDYSNLLL